MNIVKQETVLVLDDEKNIRLGLQMALENEGYNVILCHEAMGAYSKLTEGDVDLAILDIRLEGVDGLSLFKKMLNEDMSVPVIFISGHASLSEAAQAVKLGAFDFLEKPFTSEKLLITVKRCLEFNALKAQLAQIRKHGDNGAFLGTSMSVQNIMNTVEKVAATESTVLIRGESGTGKELVAQMLHEKSKRQGQPFIKVNCSAIPESLVESELFGYERGSFTGAVSAKRGYFELANRGTLFLDEIADMSLAAQAKILRTLQNSEIQKLGSEKIIKVNIRVIAATHKDLKVEVSKGRFREDLFYRINVVPIQTTPLRERPDDIALLCNSFVERYCLRNGFKVKQIEPELLDELKTYVWPGNVRELQNLVERLVIMSGEVIRLSDLPEELLQRESLDSGSKTRLSLQEFRDQAERNFIINVLKNSQGNITKAAETLGMERTYLHRRLTKFNIGKKEYFD